MSDVSSMPTDEQLDQLLEAAKRASNNAYAPYSSFRVGAALLCDDGEIVTGVNVENRSYSLSMCAERNAIGCAVALDKRVFRAVAVYSPDIQERLPPCGACRQVMSEFMDSGTPVILAGSSEVVRATVGELLPFDSLHDLRDHL